MTVIYYSPVLDHDPPLLPVCFPSPTPPSFKTHFRKLGTSRMVIDVIINNEIVFSLPP